LEVKNHFCVIGQDSIITNTLQRACTRKPMQLIVKVSRQETYRLSEQWHC